MVGKLLYLNMTRSDIFYCVQQLSQFLNAPAIFHFQAGLRVLKYLKGVVVMGLWCCFTCPSLIFCFKVIVMLIEAIVLLLQNLCLNMPSSWVNLLLPRK